MPMNHDAIISNYQILEDSDGMRKCIIVIALDASGSMSPHEDTVYQVAAERALQQYSTNWTISLAGNREDC